MLIFKERKVKKYYLTKEIKKINDNKKRERLIKKEERKGGNK